MTGTDFGTDVVAIEVVDGTVAVVDDIDVVFGRVLVVMGVVERVVKTLLIVVDTTSFFCAFIFRQFLMDFLVMLVFFDMIFQLS